ncbi:hypothetical protein SLS53_004523 [Cytospora paraplurivora]|uniref:Uncharacterized protein n=1 Tax=Cytospora paraplurivora TaxID=2898453 RepID=A0AAN9U7I3_9PEZI
MVAENRFKILYLQYGQGYNPSLQRLPDVHAADVFLGSPHPKYARDQDWSGIQSKLSLMLKCCTKLSKESLELANAERKVITNVCSHFQNAGIDVPVISTYETKTTKISSGLFRSRKEIV